jgi:hypothetical protein
LQAKPLLTDVVTATGGDAETLAIKNDGTVWNWRVGTAQGKVDFPRN